MRSPPEQCHIVAALLCAGVAGASPTPGLDCVLHKFGVLSSCVAPAQDVVFRDYWSKCLEQEGDFKSAARVLSGTKKCVHRRVVSRRVANRCKSLPR
jgi:hypothetical protein